MYSYNPYSQSYLVHYGVKGMKWGVRKKREPVTKWGQRRARTNLHNQEIKDRWERAKADVESGKLSKTSSQYRKARFDRAKNLGGRAAVSLVAGKSAQGRYYQYRDKGETKTKSLLKTIGRQSLSSAAVRAGLFGGTALVGLVAAGTASDILRENPNSVGANLVKMLLQRVY